MQSKIRKYALNGFCLGLMILLFGAALSIGKAYPAGESSYMLYKKSEYLTGPQAMALQRASKELEKPYHFTLWGEAKNQEMSAQKYGRTSKADILIINGSSKLLFPEAPLLTEKDQKGCLVSEDLAYELFGSRKVVGLTVRCQNKDYQINGTIAEAEQTMVIQSDKQTEAIMFGAALFIPKSEVRKTVATGFGQFSGMTDTKLDLDAIIRFGQTMIVLLPSCMIGVLLYQAVNRSLRFYQTPVKFLVFIISAAAGFLFIIYFVDWGPGLTLPFSPSRWSDFQYWEITSKEVQESLRDLFVIEKRTPERIIIENVLSTGRLLLLALILFIWKIRKIIPANKKELFLYSMIHVVSAFLAVLLVKEGMHIAQNAGLWLFPWFYLVGRYVLAKI